LLASNAWADKGDYLVGAGIEADNADGVAATLFGQAAVADNTWLSAAVARNTVDLLRGQQLETLFGEIGVDHYFDPVGLRVSHAYWGDDDVLDSRDWRVSLYWRSDKVTFAANYEYRDFEFDIPSTALFPGRTVNFDADGIGGSARFDLGKSADISLSGMSYDYSVNLSINTDRGIGELVSVSRLSLINSLVDYRASLSLGLDDDERRWELDIGTSEGIVDNGRTTSVTLRFLTPLGNSSDVEFGLGADDSELYGNATFLSVFVYFYGS